MLLAIAAAVLFYFVPTGVRRERKVRKFNQVPQTYRKQVKQRKKIDARRTVGRAANTGATAFASGNGTRSNHNFSRNIGWARVDDFDIAAGAPLTKEVAPLEPLPRLPDPLTARLGEIEKVEWAKVIRLEEIKTDAENNLSSETLDEILRRRRAN